MVTSDKYRHVPTRTLARLAQRIGRVFASASTWYRLVREHQWLFLNTLNSVWTVERLVAFYVEERNQHLPSRERNG